MSKPVRYVKDDLEAVIRQSPSFSSACRTLGKSPVGGNINHMKKMCQRFGIDFSHMTGKGHNRGKSSSRRKPAHEILIERDQTSHRVPAAKLRRALNDLGVAYKCNVCGLHEWNGVKITLEVDHVNDKYWDSRVENLQYICPNCHSQKPVPA